MLFRRFALGISLLMAALVSQLPEFTQQYRQRLGGAVDELTAMLSQFDSELAGQSLTRQQGIAHLAGNSDPIVQGRGAAIETAASRADRLTRQRESFSTAGPISQYAVLAERLDLGIGRRTIADFQPALPITTAGLVAALVGFALGWVLVRLLAFPFRRRPRAHVPNPVLQPR